jgi:hypothetical protein
LSPQKKRSTTTETVHKKVNAIFTANTTRRQTLHKNRNGAQQDQRHFYRQTIPAETATVSCIMGGEGKTRRKCSIMGGERNTENVKQEHSHDDCSNTGVGERKIHSFVNV